MREAPRLPHACGCVSQTHHRGALWEGKGGGLRGPSKGGWTEAGEGPWLELGQTTVGRLQAVLMAQKCPSPARRLPGPCCPYPPPAPDRLPHQEL